MKGAHAVSKITLWIVSPLARTRSFNFPFMLLQKCPSVVDFR